MDQPYLVGDMGGTLRFLWYWFLQLLGVLCITGLLALGLTIGLFGNLIGREPGIVQMIMAVPSIITNSKFLYVWGAVLVLSAGFYVFNSLRNR